MKIAKNWNIANCLLKLHLEPEKRSHIDEHASNFALQKTLKEALKP